MPDQTATPRRRRRPSDGTLQAADLTELQLAALRVIAECVALPLDQLARFLGCTPRATGSVLSTLKKRGCVESRRFLSGDSPWIWLRGTGARLSGTGLPRKAGPPAIASLAHRRAVHEVRLHLEARAPAGRWICEPYLCSQLNRSDQVPDGVFEIDGERHAIEVERSRKSDPALRQGLTESSARYDAVVYFCTPRTRGQLDRIQAAENWPKLIVRDLPGSERAPRAPARAAERDPEPWETEVLDLISEQAAIPLDQLARFQGCAMTEATQIATALTDAGYTNCEPLLADQPDWVWLRYSGVRLIPAPFAHWAPRRGGLEQIRTLNELRLQLEGRAPNSTWVGRRTLLHRLGGVRCAPDAVIELPGESHALLVRRSHTNHDVFVRRLDTIARDYDAVICFAPNATVRKGTESLHERYRWRNLTIRDLPHAERTPRARRRPRKHPPEPWRPEVLDLISEQAAIPLDQLARFQGATMTEARRLAKALTKAGYANCEPLLTGQPAWVWLRDAGVRLAGTPLGPWTPHPGGLEKIHDLNELRLHFAASTPDSTWVGRRTLLHHLGGSGRAPDAALELPGRTLALLLRRCKAANCDQLASRIDAIAREYEAVLCVAASSEARQQLASLHERYRWRNLTIRDLPRAP